MKTTMIKVTFGGADVEGERAWWGAYDFRSVDGTQSVQAKLVANAYLDLIETQAKTIKRLTDGEIVDTNDKEGIPFTFNTYEERRRWTRTYWKTDNECPEPLSPYVLLDIIDRLTNGNDN